MRIAIIGAGKVGMALGHGWARDGHDVVLATPWDAVDSALAGPNIGLHLLRR